jgi:hypothetical protein
MAKSTRTQQKHRVSSGAPEGLTVPVPLVVPIVFLLWVVICVLGLPILLLSTIFILDFGIVATTWYFFYFHFIYIIANFARNKSCFVRKLLIGDFTETNDKIYWWDLYEIFSRSLNLQAIILRKSWIKLHNIILVR